MLNPASPLPLYQQLADELCEKIRTGLYPPGARIPSEHELAARYGLGRPTVRQATEVLVRQRVLERRRGAGTFVGEGVMPEVDLFSLGGTLASFRRSGIGLETCWLKKLALRSVAPDPENPLAGRKVYTVERLGAIARKPVIVERLYFDPDVFPGLDDAPPVAVESFSQLVAQRYRLKPRFGRQTFRVHTANEAMARALKLDAGAPLLLVKRTLDFPQAPGGVFAELFCRTDEVVFAQDIGAIHHA